MSSDDQQPSEIEVSHMDDVYEVIQEEIHHGREILAALQRKRRYLEEQISRLGGAPPAALVVELDDLRNQIANVSNQLLSLEKNSRAFKSAINSTSGESSDVVEETSDHLTSAPKRVPRLVGVLSRAAVNRFFSDISESEDANREREKPFLPQWSVLRSKVHYVDANLALNYADESFTVTLLVGLMTLFLGAAMSFGVAWAASDTLNAKNVFGTATAFSTFVAVIFVVLAGRSYMKVRDLKKQFTHKGEDEDIDNKYYPSR